jgi:hypothetical protein
MNSAASVKAARRGTSTLDVLPAVSQPFVGLRRAAVLRCATALACLEDRAGAAVQELIDRLEAAG